MHCDPPLEVGHRYIEPHHFSKISKWSWIWESRILDSSLSSDKNAIHHMAERTPKALHTFILPSVKRGNNLARCCALNFLTESHNKMFSLSIITPYLLLKRTQQSAAWLMHYLPVAGPTAPAAQPWGRVLGLGCGQGAGADFLVAVGVLPFWPSPSTAASAKALELEKARPLPECNKCFY